ncbi:VOC family protein [Tengunoibacter tsumagoiensis]|uniref:VOC domain-containing protein n=1 Tax=Tengunoibacter tsumagoiensis TaxID=2014871 RepID=A0A401ZTE0_9CHLR|nr:VOC family protein [Tengunoibacter tsumagoiensis]GCE10159.1 hypothetical protein KTT_00180 [Tengunoibacter tsumagoiensis]
MSNQQIQKVKVKRLAQVGLWAKDLTAEAKFYSQVLGMQIKTTSQDDLDLDSDEANLLLALSSEQSCLSIYTDTRTANTTGRKPVQFSPLHHLTFEVDTDAELAALAARLNQSGVEFSLEPRGDDPDSGSSLWLNDPDQNRLEIVVARDALFLQHAPMKHVPLRPYGLQHIALYTARLETMVEFYTEALGFDMSDWLLRERAWLRCNQNHHTLLLIQGTPGIDHVGYTIANGDELLRWADYLSNYEVPLLWGPGRHGASNDLFLRIADPELIHLELSAEIQQYHDRDVTAPPRLWHTRTMALNLWGALPHWIREEGQA